jgi:sulfate-transporting ATPase
VQVFIQFAILGIGVGSLYALVAQGLVLIYRSTGVINFAHGAVAGVGAYVFYELHTNDNWAWPIAIVASMVASGVLGIAMQGLVMRRLRGASPLIRVIATTALLTVLVQAGSLHYGPTPVFVTQYLPSSEVSFAGIQVSADRIWLIGIVVVLTAVLWVIYRYSRFGLATTAVSESELVASSMSVSPEKVALVNWGVGSALAGLAGALIAPIVSTSPEAAGLIVVPALAASMIGSFSSFPLTLLGGMFVGIVQSEFTRYVSAPGWSDASPFLVIVVLLVLRGRALPLRGHVLERLPAVGKPRLRAFGVILGFGVGEVIILATSVNWQDAMTTSVTFGLISLSVVLLTGYAGQLSLAQFALAGMGAFVAARLDAAAHWPFIPSFLAGLVAAGLIGVVIGLPALRTRGINLAIITLGLGLSVSDIVFGNQNWTGGLTGTVVKPPTLFGFNVDAISHPERYATMALILFVLAALAVTNVRRGRVGRRLLAVRANERAAASLGISVTGAKLYAFALSAMIAATAGIIMAFQGSYVVFGGFDVLSSINAIVQTVVLGVGFVAAAVMAGVAAPAGLIPSFIDQWVNVNNYIVLVFGLILLATLPKFPNGVASNNEAQWRWLARRIPARLRDPSGERDEEPGELRVPHAVLDASHIGVSFGGVIALDDVSLSVQGGEIVGLIGSNGAGKTTLIDVISGFSRQRTGTVTLDGVSIDSCSPFQRSRRGMGRSFQSLELFDDLSVRENLLAACEPRDRLSYATTLVHPIRSGLSKAASAAVREFGLTEHLGRVPAELSSGQRRLVGLARAVAAQPSILMLDEPAAGLDESETAELGRLIRRTARDWGIGVVLVEHDLSLVLTVCDRLVVLDYGQLLAEGPTAEVAADPRVIEAFIGAPVLTPVPERGQSIGTGGG